MLLSNACFTLIFKILLCIKTLLTALVSAHLQSLLDDEVLMFKTYDSTLNPFMPTLHSAFDDNSFGDKEVSPRKSLEVRAICFFN